MAYETALWPLQTALYKRLSAALGASVTGVFDAVPQNQPFPYVVIGEPNTLPLEVKSAWGEEVTVVIHVWSDYGGKKQAFDLLNACQQALAARLSVDGFSVLRVQAASKTVFDDTNPELKHGVLRMRYTLREE